MGLPEQCKMLNEVAAVGFRRVLRSLLKHQGSGIKVSLISSFYHILLVFFFFFKSIKQRHLLINCNFPFFWNVLLSFMPPSNTVDIL